MKGTTNATLQTLFGEILNLRLVTNLSSHEDLIGTTIKINSLTYTWNGLDITVEIPAMMTYTIEVSEVEGYRTPEILTINSLTGNVNNITLSYDCELVTINVSDSDGNILDSSSVIINGIVGNKVPYGEAYTVVANTMDGYTTPSLQTYIANLPNRVINIVYKKIKLGVYIVDTVGNLVEPTSWTGGSNATGVALINDNVSIIIAPKNWYTTTGSDYDGAWNGNTRSAWGGYDKIVTGIKTTTSSSDAITDFAGSANTDAIISQLKNTTDLYNQYYTGAPAAEYCRAYSNGCKEAGQWYLPAAGEMNQIALNKTAIEEALTVINGELFNSPGYEWTSTQYDFYDVWYYRWDNGFFYDNLKGYYHGVRPICSL